MSKSNLLDFGSYGKKKGTPEKRVILPPPGPGAPRVNWKKKFEEAQQQLKDKQKQAETLEAAFDNEVAKGMSVLAERDSLLARVVEEGEAADRWALMNRELSERNVTLEKEVDTWKTQSDTDSESCEKMLEQLVEIGGELTIVSEQSASHRQALDIATTELQKKTLGMQEALYIQTVINSIHFTANSGKKRMVELIIGNQQGLSFSAAVNFYLLERIVRRATG